MSEKKSVAGIVLAAGLGTRMKSKLPKVVHKIAGLPIAGHVIEALKSSGVEDVCLVLGDQLNDYNALLDHYDVNVVIQKNRLGTADAVAAASFSFLDVKIPSYTSSELTKGKRFSSSHVLICAGDTPAIRSEIICSFIEESMTKDVELSVLGANMPDPKGYGRLVLDDSGFLSEIVEEKDADEKIREITICNTGVIFGKTKTLFSLLDEVKPDNVQKEYYLTDCVSIARKRKLKTSVFITNDYESFAGINDRIQLSKVEKSMVARKINSLMLRGVSFKLPDTSYVESCVEIENDTIVEACVSICGKTKIEASCFIGSGSKLDSVVLESGVVIGEGSILRNCRIKEGEILPPLTMINKS